MNNFVDYERAKADIEQRLRQAQQPGTTAPQTAPVRLTLRQRFCSRCGALLMHYGERLLAAAPLPQQGPEERVIFE